LLWLDKPHESRSALLTNSATRALHRPTTGPCVSQPRDGYVGGYGCIMPDSQDWTPGEIAGLTANPFYAINIDEGLAMPHEPLISEDEWIKANVSLIKELGPEAYLHNLLSVLKGNYPRS
jgi:hypothetical protein